MRFAVDSLQKTARTVGGRNGLNRLASHQLEQISINLTLSFARRALRDEAISTHRALSARDCFAVANKEQDGPRIRYGKNASPAKAGAHPPSAQQADKWIPAFAGKVLWRRFHPGWVGRAGRSPTRNAGWSEWYT